MLTTLKAILNCIIQFQFKCNLITNDVKLNAKSDLLPKQYDNILLSITSDIIINAITTLILKQNGGFSLRIIVIKH